VALHSTYDPATDSWEALPDAPHARDHLAMAAIDDRLVVTAGRDGGLSSFVDATDVYDPGSGWESGAAVPTPRGGVAAAALDGALHVFGGEGNAAEPTGVFATHDSYDPITDSWTSRDPMPSPRHGTGAAALDGMIWIPGGADVQAFGAVDTNEGWAP
jgi:N-acetylneuraminic acid mutarotase